MIGAVRLSRLSRLYSFPAIRVAAGWLAWIGLMGLGGVSDASPTPVPLREGGESGLLGRLGSLNQKYSFLPSVTGEGETSEPSPSPRLFTPLDLARLLGAQAGWWKDDSQRSGWEISLDYLPGSGGSTASGVGGLASLPFREIRLKYHLGPEIGWGFFYRRGEDPSPLLSRISETGDASNPTLDEMIRWELEIKY